MGGSGITAWVGVDGGGSQVLFAQVMSLFALGSCRVSGMSGVLCVVWCNVPGRHVSERGRSSSCGNAVLCQR